MKKSKLLSPKFLIGILITLFFGIALYLRVYLPYDQIFTADWIKFASNDAYYHMRLVDNLVHNFPHHMSFDPYSIYPGATEILSIRFFDWLLASIIWVIGLGSPTQHTIDVVGVYFPAVLGALTVIPVYFIGKELLSRWAGVLAAGLIVLLPGEFLGRSILGSTDYHVAEALFTTVTMLFLILAIKAASQRGLTFGHLKHRDWGTIAKPVIYSLVAGIFLGVYILTWLGALLFVFIIAVYFVIQFIIDHLKHKSTDYLCLVGVILFFVSFIMSLLSSQSRLFIASLIIALLTPLVLSGVSRLMASKEIKPAYYPLTLLGLGLAGWGLFYLINPSLLNSMFAGFSIFAPAGLSFTTIEMQPLLFPNGTFSLIVVWGNFTTGFFLSFICLCLLIYLIIKQGDAEKSLLVVWSLVILAAALGQRRFAYYLAVNVALLTGYLSWQFLSLAGFKKQAAKPAETLGKRDYYEVLGISRKATTKEIKRAFQKLSLQYQPDREHRPKAGERMVEINEAYEVLSDPRKRAAYDRLKYGRSTKKVLRRESSKSGFRINTGQVFVMALAVLVIFFVAFFWNIEPAIATASQVSYAPSDAWCSSLSWMKENTPDPFGNPDFYYELNEPPPTGENYTYPESAYGVMAWWDYGYWITRIAHRLPNANPSQDPNAITNVASFFTSQDEESANEIARELGSSYVIVDYETAFSKLWAIILWAGRGQTEYGGYYYLPEENQMQEYLHPEYYRLFSTRLYNFDGKAITPKSTLVISYQLKVTSEGMFYNEVTSQKEFDSYEEAEAYLSSQESGNYKIVGTSPFDSPVPLEELKHYKLVYSSDEPVMLPDVGMIPAVKIFEYLD